MALKDNPLEQQIDSLNEHLQTVNRRLDELASRLSRIEATVGGRQVEESSEIVADRQAARKRRAEMAPERWSGRAVVLPRIATVCFLMVFALILRTITDNGVVNISLGSFIGLGYAALLMGIGWYLFERDSRLAPVFPVCGILLLYSIVLETHARFGTVSTFWSYALLFGGLAVTAVAGVRFRTNALLTVGILGSGLLGMGIGFPNPAFPLAGLVLAIGILIADVAASRDAGPALRWATLVLAMVFWIFWVVKLQIPLSRGQEILPIHYAGWYFPMVFLFFLVYLAIGTRGAWVAPGPLFFYEGVLPSINVLWSYGAVIAIVLTGFGKPLVVGALAILTALGHFSLAVVMTRRHAGAGGAPGANAFSLAGALMLAMGLPLLTGEVAWALPILSAVALGLALVSERWQHGGVRVTAYFLQVGTLILGLASHSFAVDEVSTVAGCSAGAAILFFALIQYRWCRTHPPHADKSAYFTWVDRHDISAAALLAVGLLGGFVGARLALHAVLAGMIEDPANAFRCGQSIMINIGAIVLMVLAAKTRKLEIGIAAVAVGLLGALKVFFYDLFTSSGMPLVIDVFSFGIVAAVGSVVSSRWHQQRAHDSARKNVAPVGEVLAD